MWSLSSFLLLDPWPRTTRVGYHLSSSAHSSAILIVLTTSKRLANVPTMRRGPLLRRLASASSSTQRRRPTVASLRTRLLAQAAARVAVSATFASRRSRSSTLWTTTWSRRRTRTGAVPVHMARIVTLSRVDNEPSATFAAGGSRPLSYRRSGTTDFGTGRYLCILLDTRCCNEIIVKHIVYIFESDILNRGRERSSAQDSTFPLLRKVERCAHKTVRLDGGC